MQSTIFTCHHKVIKGTCGPKLPQNVFSSSNSPEKVLNGIPQMSETPWKKDHLGLEKSIVTKYGSKTHEMTFHFSRQKKNWYVSIKKSKNFYSQIYCKKNSKNFHSQIHCKKNSKFFYSQIHCKIHKIKRLDNFAGV